MITRKLKFYEDLPELIRGGASFMKFIIERSPEFYDCFTQDPETLKTVLTNLHRAGVLHGIVAEVDGKLVSGCLFCTVRSLWNTKITTAEELCWWAYQDAPPTAAYRVIKEALQYMKDLGTRYQIFSVMDVSDTRVIKVYQRLGLKYSQTNYVGVS